MNEVRREKMISWRKEAMLSLSCFVLILCSRAVGPMSPNNGEALDFGGPDLVAELEASLRFEPPQLDFGSWSVGSAHSYTVTLFNQNRNRSVYLSSVSGRTPAFYSSFFEAKVVPPHGNTTFSVVFLPREYGVVTTDLLIHTSFGQARLMVRGEGSDCPYRLKPIVGIKAPLNATLTPEIHLYNPHSQPLQILEIYSSGGQFQLELPSGGPEGPQALWEIPPYCTKPIIKIRFHGQSSGNHSAYIRIKIVQKQRDNVLTIMENTLVVPVEIEVLPHYGLYAENPLLDFSYLSTAQSVQLRKLILHNSHHSSFHELAEIETKSIPGITFDASTANIALDPRAFEKTMMVDELLILRSTLNSSTSNKAHHSEFSIRVRAEIFKGSLNYDPNVTIFIKNATNAINEERELLVKNEFELPLTVLNIQVENNNTDFLEVALSKSLAEPGMVLDPGESFLLARLKVKASNINYRAVIRVVTNMAPIEIPVIVCSGKMHVSTQNLGHLTLNSTYGVELDLGAIPLAEMSHNGYIVLTNNNPTVIKMNTWTFQTPKGILYHATFMGCLRQGALKDLPDAGVQIDSSKFQFCSHANEGDVVVFSVAIQSYISDCSAGNLTIFTDYETLNVTVKFKTWMGKLEVDQEQLYFKNCFPGKLCYSDLSIRSSFRQAIHVSSINFTDAGLYFKDHNPSGTTILPEATTKIGRIYFQPSVHCRNKCYIPQDDSTSGIAFPKPNDTKGGSNNNLHFDESELRHRTQLYRQLKWHFQSITFTLTSREVRQFLLQLIIDLEWPKLVKGKQIFSTIELGQRQLKALTIQNPSDSPLLVDYFLADPSFAKQTQLSLPLEVVDLLSNCYLTDKDVFSIISDDTQKPVLIPPRKNISIFIQFEAGEADSYCTVLHIRNNLTLYEAVWMTGKSVQSQFRFGNRKPGSSTPLLFEINEKQLASCGQSLVDRTKQYEKRNTEEQNYSSLVIKRTFTARNTGEVPISVHSFLIGDNPCEGFGFKVLNCSSFELKGNTSKKIEIAFTPDFTSARIVRPLTLQTNLSYEITYVLLAQLPRQQLEYCAELQPRPSWEKRMRNIALILLAISFVVVFLAVHVDYGHILLTKTTLYNSREQVKGPIHPTFNLRNIATKTSVEEDPQPKVLCNANKANAQCLKKRSVKRVSSNGSSGNTSNPAAIDFSNQNSSFTATLPAVQAPTVKETPNMKKAQISNERPVKVKSELNKVESETLVLSSNNLPTQLNSHNTSVTKPPQLENYASVGCIAATGKKPSQRGVKKLKNNNQVTNNVDCDMLLQKPVPKIVKQTEKAPGAVRTSAHSPNLKIPAEIPKNVVELVNGSSRSKPKLIIPSKDTLMNKCGKTPGRERKKNIHRNDSSIIKKRDNCNTAISTSSSATPCLRKPERKQNKKIATALNFSTWSPSDTNNYAGDVSVITSPWKTINQISIRDALESYSGTARFQNSDRIANNLSTLNTDLNYHSSLNPMNSAIATAQITPNSTIEKLNSEVAMEPIGSKKSLPLRSTSVENPLSYSCAPRDSALIAEPTKRALSNNSSFFSNLLPSYPYSSNELSISNGNDLQPNQSEFRSSQWEWLDQQACRPQQQFVQDVNAVNNWPLNSPTWSSIVYGQNFGNTPINPPDLGQTSTWNGTNFVRPPPGLEANFQNTPQLQQHSVRQDNEHLQPLLTTEMQPFDPFSSLSSIWSDNWSKTPKQNSN